MMQMRDRKRLDARSNSDIFKQSFLGWLYTSLHEVSRFSEVLDFALHEVLLKFCF